MEALNLYGLILKCVLNLLSVSCQVYFCRKLYYDDFQPYLQSSYNLILETFEEQIQNEIDLE